MNLLFALYCALQTALPLQSPTEMGKLSGMDISSLFSDQESAQAALDFLSGKRNKTDLTAFALARAQLGITAFMVDEPSIEEVEIPHGPEQISFFGGGDVGPCAGSRMPGQHAFSIPSYVSILYRRTVYDPGPERWASSWDETPEDEPNPDLGVRGDGLGVAYTGWVQRIWGHGFYIEIETDPLNGVNQSIGLVHFIEDECETLPGLEIPCIKVQDLYTFSWSIRDARYQVRRVADEWQTPYQLMDLYLPGGWTWVSGTPGFKRVTLDGLDAGFAEGRTTIYTTAGEFPWEPCGDFLFNFFHVRTQKRMNSWPGRGMPLLFYTRSRVTDKQRRQTHNDFENARGTPTELDLEAGTAAHLGATETDPNLLSSENYSSQTVQGAKDRLEELENQLVALGDSFQGSHLAQFAGFARRHFDHHRIVYIHDLDDAEKTQELSAKLPAWAAQQIRANPSRGFQHAVLEWMEIDWSPPYLNQRYRDVLNHPNEVIPTLTNLDKTSSQQTEMVKDVVSTTAVIERNTDPNRASGWPQWAWPNIENPDTYWTIYLTWN